MQGNGSHWNYARVLSLVQHHVGESGWFDFKEVLTATRAEDKRDHKASVQRTACAMANSGGGVLIFGVVDEQNAKGKLPEERITGLPHDGRFAKEFDDAMGGIEPRPGFQILEAIVHPTRSGWEIPVVWILDSPIRPHMVTATGVFYRRGNGATAPPMKFAEVRDQMLYGFERLRKAKLLRLELEQYRSLAAALHGQKKESIRDRFDTSDFRSLVADTCGLFPQGGSLLSSLLARIIHGRSLVCGEV